MLAPRQQGDVGELSAIVWLAAQGFPVFKPLFHSPNYDLVADLGRRLVRVEVKTTTQFRKGRWDVSVCTRGGNQSWNGVVKRLDREELRLPIRPRARRAAMVHPVESLRRRYEGCGSVARSTRSSRSSEAIRSRKARVSGPPLQSALLIRPGGCPSGQRRGAVNALALPTQVRILLPPLGRKLAYNADVAQLVEHLHGKEGVRGSSPLVGSSGRPHLTDRASSTRKDRR